MFKETQEGGGRKEEKIKGSLEGTTQKAAFLFTFSSPPCMFSSLTLLVRIENTVCFKKPTQLVVPK